MEAEWVRRLVLPVVHTYSLSEEGVLVLWGGVSFSSFDTT